LLVAVIVNVASPAVMLFCTVFATARSEPGLTFVLQVALATSMLLPLIAVALAMLVMVPVTDDVISIVSVTDWPGAIPLKVHERAPWKIEQIGLSEVSPP